MHATCRRHAPWRIKYQPVERNTVLTKLSEALIAGRSEMEGINSTFNLQPSTFNLQRSTLNVQRSTSNAQRRVEPRHFDWSVPPLRDYYFFRGDPLTFAGC